MITYSTSWHWDILVAAFILSSFGCATSLQLTKHHTGQFGIRNWYILFLCTYSLYIIGIWCTHYISMLALEIEKVNHETGVITDVPIEFNVAFLIVSFILPLPFVVVGLFLSSHHDPKWWHVLGGGIITATGAIATFFLSSLAIQIGVTPSLDVGWSMGCVVVGLVAATIILALFFYFQKLWKTNEFVLIVAGIAMGFSITAMHVLGIEGISFEDKYPLDSTGPVTKTAIIIIVSIFSGICLFFLLFSLLSIFRATKIDKHNVQCIILSAMITDGKDRILVTTTGALPSVKIEQIYDGQGNFDASNKDFLAMFKTSFNWLSCQENLEKLNDKLTRREVNRYSVELYAKFVEAANNLARALGQDLQNLGVMHLRPLGDMMTLVSTARNASRFSDTGLYRWAPQDVVISYVDKHYLHDLSKSQEWMEQVSQWYKICTMEVRNIAPLPIAPDNDPKALASIKIIGSETPMRKGSIPEANPDFADDGIPIESGQIYPIFNEKKSGENHARSSSTSQFSRVLHSRNASRTTNGGHSRQSSLFDDLDYTPPNGCRLYVGLFYAQVSSGGVSILLPSNGPLHTPPCVRIRLDNSSTPNKSSLTDSERDWLIKLLTNPETNQWVLPDHIDEMMNDLNSRSFHRAFLRAVYELGRRVGSSNELRMSNFFSVYPVSLSHDCHIFCFTSSTMNPTFPAHYNPNALQLYPIRIFETISSSKHIAPTPSNWIERLTLNTTAPIEHRRALAIKPLE